MEKPASTRFPLTDGIRRRWSPRAFAATALTTDELGALLEAARWAPSCFNDQPWRFLVTRQGQAGWQRLLECLTPGNRLWCERVPVLMLSVAVPRFRHSGAENRHAGHDVGMASAQMALQAQALGLAVHFMAGFDRQRARTAFAVPAEHEPMAAIAVGHPGGGDELPEALRVRERLPRQRLVLAEIAFGEVWGEPLPLE